MMVIAAIVIINVRTCTLSNAYKITGHINFIYTSQVVLVWLPLLSFGLSQNLEE